MKVLLKPPQWTVFSCDQRFRVLVAGRRFGKTYLAMVELCRAASTRAIWRGTSVLRTSRRSAYFGASQGNDAAVLGSRPNETDLRNRSRLGRNHLPARRR